MNTTSTARMSYSFIPPRIRKHKPDMEKRKQGFRRMMQLELFKKEK